VSTPAKIAKRVLPPQWIARIRKLGRFRWYAKYKNVRAGGVDVRRQPVRIVRHVLLDPEVDNYTYELENAEELAPFLARALGVPEAEAARVLDEAATDQELDRELARRVRWRFDTKWRIHLGRRVLWYALVRLRRPGLVVEAGVQEGLGTLVLLRALERNTADGARGRLLSIDPLANAGWLVPGRLRAGWTFVNARSEQGLARALDGLEVDVLLSDSGGSYERELGEYEAARFCTGRGRRFATRSSATSTRRSRRDRPEPARADLPRARGARHRLSRGPARAAGPGALRGASGGVRVLRDVRGADGADDPHARAAP
jgi:hypothetical protein